MPKLSPNYREDNPDGLPEDVQRYLDEHFLENLDHLDERNPKLLVVFSGGNAVGKSTLSKRIGRELGAVVLENDAIKEQLLEFKPEIERDELNSFTWKYSIDLYKRLGAITSNGLVVRDGVIDWYYDRVLPIFESQGYDLFTIGYDLSRQKRTELIRLRGDKTTVSAERLAVILDDHDIHTKRFRSHHTPNVLLDDDNVFNHDMVLEKLRTYLAELRRSD